MNKLKKYSGVAIILIAGTITYMLLKAYHYYAPPKYRMAFQIKHINNDTLHIAYIGDSWAYMHNNHQCQIPHLIKGRTFQTTKVYSYGLPGRTSKEIYEALFDDVHLVKYMKEQGCDYCFISAGINDINKKLSITYYIKSMNGIIRFLLSNNVHPIILEIPDFDVYKVYRGHDKYRKLLRKISMTINNVPLDCKQLYRDALDDLIHKEGYQDKVSIIRYRSWNHDYYNDLNNLYLNDGVHLNNYGYSVLDSMIAKEIQ